MVGTTFSFTLPKASETQIEQTHSTDSLHFKAPDVIDIEPFESSSTTEDESAPLLLVVDDEPVNLRILDSFLRVEGYRIRTAQNGEEAIKALNNEKPALVLLDIMMPGVSGFRFAKPHARNSIMPNFIMLTL